MSIPNGYTEIKNKYGNPSAGGGKPNKQWYNTYIIKVQLPYPMRWDGNSKNNVTSVLFNKEAADALVYGLTLTYRYVRSAVKKAYGYDKTTEFYDQKTTEYLAKYRVDVFGGTFIYRAKRTNPNELSMHSYGIAIDIDPSHNPLGAKEGTIPSWFTASMQKAGFNWGGSWHSTKDIMHYQLATGA